MTFSPIVFKKVKKLEMFNVFKIHQFQFFEILTKSKFFIKNNFSFVGFKNMEIFDYIAKYVRYEDGPKRQNVMVKVVYAAMVFTEASVTYQGTFPG